MGSNQMYRRPAPPQRQTRPSPAPQRPAAGCEELLRAIAEADFFAQDLKLYLDTHPDDTRAVEMFVDACRQSKACKAAFEDSYYPLTACNAGKDGCWDWPEGVWPPFN